jgi:hypothetical protein
MIILLIEIQMAFFGKVNVRDTILSEIKLQRGNWKR